MTDNNRHAGNGQHDGSTVPARAPTREDFLGKSAEVRDHLRQQHPELSDSELDLKLSSEWWKPMFDLSTAVDESLPKDVNDKLQAASKDFASANYSREALDKFTAEARTLLADFDEVLRLLESTVLKNPSVWDKMHKHAMAKQEKGNMKGE